MHINTYFRSAGEALIRFQESIFRPIIDQNKKIVTIGTIVLGALALSFLIKRCWSHLHVVKQTKKQEASSQDPMKGSNAFPPSNNEHSSLIPESGNATSSQSNVPHLKRSPSEELIKEMTDLAHSPEKSSRNNNKISTDQPIFSSISGPQLQTQHSSNTIKKQEPCLNQTMDENVKRIKELKSEIEKKEEKINTLSSEISQLSDGVVESEIASISYNPNDDIELPSGEITKAHAFKGELDHELEIHDDYTEISLKNGEFSTYLPKPDEWAMFITGNRYEKIGKLEGLKSWGNQKNTYFFKTKWEGDGVLPEIKIHCRRLKASANQATIANKKVDIQTVKDEIAYLKQRINVRMMPS